MDHWAFSVSHSIYGGGCGGSAREKYAVGKLVTKVKIRTNQMYKLLAHAVYGCTGIYTGIQMDIAFMQSVTVMDIHTHIHAWTGTHTHACEVVNTGPHCPLVSGN